MPSKIVTNWLRDLAERLTMISGSCGVDEADVKQCIDLADTLDEYRINDEVFRTKLSEFSASMGSDNK